MSLVVKKRRRADTGRGYAVTLINKFRGDPLSTGSLLSSLLPESCPSNSLPYTGWTNKGAITIFLRNSSRYRKSEKAITGLELNGIVKPSFCVSLYKATSVPGLYFQIVLLGLERYF